MHRSRMTREEILERMKNQMSDDDRIKQSDYVIDNSENAMIIPAILNIHNDIMKSVNPIRSLRHSKRPEVVASSASATVFPLGRGQGEDGFENLINH
jgi:hypothetical protein